MFCSVITSAQSSADSVSIETNRNAKGRSDFRAPNAIFTVSSRHNALLGICNEAPKEENQCARWLLDARIVECSFTHERQVGCFIFTLLGAQT